MKKMKTKVLSISTVMICLLSFSCQKTGNYSGGINSGKSSVNIYLTDDPSVVFEHVFLDISKVEIKVEDDSESSHEREHQGEVDDNDRHGEISGGWVSVPIHAGVYDILKFRNGLDTLFATTTFDAGRDLRKVRLTLGSNNSIVLNGTSFPLTLNSNDNFVVIQIDESSVAINSGGITNFWIDIDAGRSIRQHGDQFELKPSVKVFSKEKSGSIEGRVLPASAAAVVMAINGTDTATAKPEAEGEFKIIGLKPGTYTLIYHATANNYVDATVNNVIISGTEDTHVQDVTLHQ